MLLMWRVSFTITVLEKVTRRVVRACDTNPREDRGLLIVLEGPGAAKSLFLPLDFLVESNGFMRHWTIGE